MHTPTLRTFAAPEALEEIEQVLAALWAAHPHVPESTRVRVGIAVTEVAANIIEHATKGLDRLVHLHVWASVQDTEVLIAFVDDGIPASAVSVAEMPDEFAESGRGLPLAQAVLRELGYQRADELNHWTLVSEVFG